MVLGWLSVESRAFRPPTKHHGGGRTFVRVITIALPEFRFDQSGLAIAARTTHANIGRKTHTGRKTVAILLQGLASLVRTDFGNEQNGDVLIDRWFVTTGTVQRTQT